MIKDKANKILEALGYEIRSKNRPMRSFAQGMEQLGALFSPETVIDVGVAQGTPALYRHFPECDYLLVEANPVFTEDLDGLSSQLDASIEKVFCGAGPGVVELNVYDDPRKSSVNQWMGDRSEIDKIEVPVATLDSLVDKNDLRPPFLLKIDVEGAELEVLEGATSALQHCEALIIEVAVLPKFRGGPEMSDVICFMAERGYAVFDILNAVDYKNTGVLYQADLVFVDKASCWRDMDHLRE